LCFPPSTCAVDISSSLCMGIKDGMTAHKIPPFQKLSFLIWWLHKIRERVRTEWVNWKRRRNPPPAVQVQQQAHWSSRQDGQAALMVLFPLR
jgi:hypothetical protein